MHNDRSSDNGSFRRTDASAFSHFSGCIIFVSQSTLLAVGAKLIACLVLAERLPIAQATFSVTKCCVIAVRQDFERYIDHYYPWEVCNFNVEIDYRSNLTYPSIVRSMSWAKQFCRGTEYSTTSEWLQPLVTYISPYIGILLLCPIGDNAVRWSLSRTPLINDFLVAVWKYLREYSSILGDPASAIFGAASEILADATALTRISTQNVADTWDSNQQHWRSWVAALAGAIKFSAGTGWDPGFLKPLQALATHSDLQTSTANTSPVDEHAGSSTMGEVEHLGLNTGFSKGSGNNSSVTCSDKVSKAINIVIVSRADFVNGILLPVIITLAITAATFYDAYARVGDKDTALALAYGVSYSWILVVGVAGNCFATAVNPDLARQAFDKVVNFGDESSADVALRNRHVNNQFWNHWATHDEPDFETFTRQLGSSWRFWLRFCAGQFFGWCCVAIATSAAAAIAWTTPTTGLGCRAFNFILYTILSFIVALLHVLCSWLDVHSQQQVQPNKHKMSRENHRTGFMGRFKFNFSISYVARCAYWSLAFCNALVMILGTLFHLIGFFRTCWCENLAWDDNSSIELNRKTDQAVHNAQRYWLSTAYVAFGFMWLVCLTAITLRQYIGLKMDNWMVLCRPRVRISDSTC